MATAILNFTVQLRGHPLICMHDDTFRPGHCLIVHLNYVREVCTYYHGTVIWNSFYEFT